MKTYRTKEKPTGLINAEFKSREVWKDITGFEGFYKISSEGRILSVAREYLKVNVKGSKQTGCTFRHSIPDRILTTQLGKRGYFVIQLKDRGNKRKTFTIHRLLALHFIPNPDNKPQVNHINGIKTDNRIENLEWCTCKENIQHAYNNGLNHNSEKKRIAMSKTGKKNIGGNAPNGRSVVNKITGQYFDTIQELSKYLKIAPTTLHSQLHGRYKNKTGFELTEKRKDEIIH